MIEKLIYGYVIQEFDENGKFISQSFKADDEVVYLKDGEDMENPPEFHHPLDMIQG